MKKLYLFLLLLCNSYAFAFQTTFTTSILANEATDYISCHNENIPTTTARRVRFINRMDTCPTVAIAFSKAEDIFSDAMKAENMDLVPIEAEVWMGDANDFASEELCKVSVLYTDELTSNEYYPRLSQYYYSDIPILLPMTIYNQSKGYSSGPSMQIYLNPTLSYHFGTSALPQGKVDAITILLRALAIGCGIQSSFNPGTQQFGVNYNGQTYIHAFDSRIYNDLNVTYSDVINEDTMNAATFLTNRTIYADGVDEFGIHPVQLYNDWEIGNNVPMTINTMNTISFWNYTVEENEANFYDLLDAYWNEGIEQRQITPYTMALLRGLGWQKDIPVGLNENLVNLYNSTLYCSSTTLYPSQTYHVWLSANFPLSDIVCKLQSNDSAYLIATGNANNDFSFTAIPNNIQWKRNQTTKNIIGQIQAWIGILFGGEYIEVEKIYDIEIPYKPNKPIIQKSEETANGYINLHLNAFADGSNTYTVSYTGVTYEDTHIFTVTADALDTILTNITGNQLYNLSIYGTNNVGNSDTCHFTFGFSAHPVLNMTISVWGSTLRYDLSNNGTIDISELNISSVTITNQYGIIVMTPTAGSGDPINISALSRGYYIITVVADGNVYSQMFMKR